MPRRLPDRFGRSVGPLALSPVGLMVLQMDRVSWQPPSLLADADADAGSKSSPRRTLSYPKRQNIPPESLVPTATTHAGRLRTGT